MSTIVTFMSVGNLNTIYFTSITQKAHGTYKRILEGADVGVCGLAWWRKLGKTLTLDRPPLPCHMPIPGY